MRRGPSGTASTPGDGLFRQLGRLVVLLLPVLVLLVASLRVESNQLLWVGTAIQALGFGLALLARRGRREVTGPAVIMLYVIALSWLLLGTQGEPDWVLHLGRAILLVIPLFFFALQCLRDSGATMMRRARQLAARLATRRSWPADLLSCRLLPEVKALRESLHVDASPALELLSHARAEVRVAALAALEYRPQWRPGQPQVVLSLARKAPEPEVRACAVMALANVEERLLIEALAELMRDPSQLVRQTATESLLWNCEQHWAWIRPAVRQALADPNSSDDGPLKLGNNQLTAEAISDLHGWAAEKGVVAVRAALTLGVHYGRVLATGVDPALLSLLRQQLLDARTPHLWRLELARLLSQHRELDETTLQRLLEPSLPAPVRLIAVETLLTQGQDAGAIATLHELARLPNRELALATADVVQRRLGIDMGLPRTGGLPPLHSRTAAEVARRVLHWAHTHDMDPVGQRLE